MRHLLTYLLLQPEAKAVLAEPLLLRFPMDPAMQRSPHRQTSCPLPALVEVPLRQEVEPLAVAFAEVVAAGGIRARLLESLAAVDTLASDRAPEDTDSCRTSAGNPLAVAS